MVDFEHNSGRKTLTKIFKQISTILWIGTVFTTICIAFFLVSLSLNRIKDTPHIHVIESSNHPVFNIAFPAIAICNSNVVWRPNAINITEKLLGEKVPENDIKQFLGNLSSLIEFKEVNRNLFYIFDLLESKFNYTVDSLMKELAQPCSRMMYICKFLSEIKDCQLLFRIAKTELGYCCTFNYKSDRTSSKKDVMTKEERDQLEAPEERISGAGEDSGIEAFIKIDESEYMSQRKSLIGAEVIVFDPYDYPARNFISSINHPQWENLIGVKPILIDTELDLRSLPINVRECRFQLENKNLIMSEKYSYEVCMAECRAKTFLLKCNCLPFFYPILDYLRNGLKYRQCNFKDLNCLEEKKNIFFSLPLEKNLYSIINDSTEGLRCKCPQGCRSKIYNTETFYFKRMDLKNESLGVLNVYYKQLSFMKYKRKVYITWDGVFATVGGIFAFCTGASIISLQQLFYYLTFKPFEIYLTKKREIEEKDLRIWFQYYIKDYGRPTNTSLQYFNRKIYTR